MKKIIIPTITFILLLLGMALFPLIPIYLFNIDINVFTDTIKILYTFACDLGWMIITYMVYRKIVNADFKEYFKDFKHNFIISIKYYLIGFAIMVVSNVVIGTFINSAMPANEDSVRSMIDSYPIYMIFSVGIYAPFVEELVFRKSIKDIIYSFGKNNITKYLYIFISGFIFAGLHIFGLTNSYIDYIYLIPYLSLGIAFSSLYAKTDNIWPTIIIHSLHNLMALILYLGVGI